MVLSNAERQRRHRERIRAAARAGVTAEDVRQVGRAILARTAVDDPDFNLEQWRAYASTRKGRDAWHELFQDLRADEIEDGEYGADTELVRRVALVAAAMRDLPPESDPQ